MLTREEYRVPMAVACILAADAEAALVQAAVAVAGVFGTPASEMHSVGAGPDAENHVQVVQALSDAADRAMAATGVHEDLAGAQSLAEAQAKLLQEASVAEEEESQARVQSIALAMARGPGASEAHEESAAVAGTRDEALQARLSKGQELAMEAQASHHEAESRVAGSEEHSAEVQAVAQAHEGGVS